MIEYQNFIATVSSLLPSYMPEEFHDMKVTHDRVMKVNREEPVLICAMPDSNTSVMLYCNDLYSIYQRSGNMTDVLTRVSGMIIHAFRNKPKYACVEELTKDPEKKIIFQLIQTKRNRELLKDIPHRNFLDLSIIYRIVANSTDDGINTVIITNRIAQRLAMTEEQLYQCAFRNTREILPPEIATIASIHLGKEAEMGIPEHDALWMIGNRCGLFGAAMVLYPDILATVAKRIGSDLYLLPSSIHEFITCTTDDRDADELRNAVRDINEDEVAVKDQLSDQIYRYSRETGEIVMVTNTETEPTYPEMELYPKAMQNYWKS